MTLRKVVIRVAIMNLVYWGVECGVALAIGSVSLFADSVYRIPRKSFPDAIARDAFCFEPFVL
jgi:hypothetical protein